MNLCDCYVKEILSPVYTQYGKWWVRVSYESWGNGESSLMFDTQDEAKNVDIGYHFLA